MSKYTELVQKIIVANDKHELDVLIPEAVSYCMVDVYSMKRLWEDNGRMRKPKMKIGANICREVFNFVNNKIENDGIISVIDIYERFGNDPWFILQIRNCKNSEVPMKPVWTSINDFGEVFAKCFEIDLELDKMNSGYDYTPSIVTDEEIIRYYCG